VCAVQRDRGETEHLSASGGTVAGQHSRLHRWWVTQIIRNKLVLSLVLNDDGDFLSVSDASSIQLISPIIKQHRCQLIGDFVRCSVDRSTGLFSSINFLLFKMLFFQLSWFFKKISHWIWSLFCLTILANINIEKWHPDMSSGSIGLWEDQHIPAASRTEILG